MVRGLFSDWAGEGKTLRKVPYTLPSGRGWKAVREMLQTHLIYGFTGPGLIDADRYPVEVMNAILSGMGGGFTASSGRKTLSPMRSPSSIRRPSRRAP